MFTILSWDLSPWSSCLRLTNNTRDRDVEQWQKIGRIQPQLATIFTIFAYVSATIKLVLIFVTAPLKVSVGFHAGGRSRNEDNPFNHVWISASKSIGCQLFFMDWLEWKLSLAQQKNRSRQESRWLEICAERNVWLFKKMIATWATRLLRLIKKPTVTSNFSSLFMAPNRAILRSIVQVESGNWGSAAARLRSP